MGGCVTKGGAVNAAAIDTSSGNYNSGTPLHFSSPLNQENHPQARQQDGEEEQQQTITATTTTTTDDDLSKLDEINPTGDSQINHNNSGDHTAGAGADNNGGSNNNTMKGQQVQQHRQPSHNRLSSNDPRHNSEYNNSNSKSSRSNNNSSNSNGESTSSSSSSRSPPADDNQLGENGGSGGAGGQQPTPPEAHLKQRERRRLSLSQSEPVRDEGPDGARGQLLINNSASGEFNLAGITPDQADMLRRVSEAQRASRKHQKPKKERRSKGSGSERSGEDEDSGTESEDLAGSSSSDGSGNDSDGSSEEANIRNRKHTSKDTAGHPPRPPSQPRAKRGSGSSGGGGSSSSSDGATQAPGAQQAPSPSSQKARKPAAATLAPSAGGKPGAGAPQCRRLSVSGMPSTMQQNNFENKRQEVKSDTGFFDANTLFSLGIGYACKKGLKPESPNQDDFFIVRIDDWGLYGVFDGHGPYGHDVSHFVQRELPKLVYSNPKFISDPKVALRESFIHVHTMLENASTTHRMFDCSLSGCTATVVLHRKNENKIFTAHVGDSRCVLGRIGANGKIESVDVTTDHKPNNEHEKRRIVASGGQVRRLDGDIPYRVFLKNKLYPGLAMSRAIGDSVGTQAGVICEPDVSEYVIDPKSDIFITLCSDGVWEFLSSSEVAETIHMNGLSRVQASADAIARESWNRWIQEEGNVVDDITCEIIYLSPERRRNE